MSRRYVVIGAGAVGAALAAGLDGAGIPTVLVSRGSTYDAILDGGLTVTHAGRTDVLPVRVVSGPADIELTTQDVLVLAVKSQDAASALEQWARVPVTLASGDVVTAGSAVPVVTLQNGIAAEPIALRHFERVIAGVALIAARHIIAGEVRVFNAPAIGQAIIGAFPDAASAPGAQQLVGGIAADLRAAKWLVHETDDPSRWKAWKLLIAVSFAASVFGGDDAALESVRRAARDEAAEVLARAGYDIADPDSELSFDRSLASPLGDPEYDPVQLSTWQSFTRGSSSEIDYLNGEIVLQARLQGRQAPVNAAIQGLLALAAERGDRPGSVSAQAVPERRAADGEADGAQTTLITTEGKAA
jgi:2-dehydropantoate 2-reductase